MHQNKQNKFLTISIVISLLSIASTLVINYFIAKEYLRSDGKTKALFGIKELYQFGYQYYIVALGFIAMIFILPVIKCRHPLKWKAIFLNVIAIIIVFVRIWRVL
jgi:hypothetical protein